MSHPSETGATLHLPPNGGSYLAPVGPRDLPPRNSSLLRLRVQRDKAPSGELLPPSSNRVPIPIFTRREEILKAVRPSLGYTPTGGNEPNQGSNNLRIWPDLLSASTHLKGIFIPRRADTNTIVFTINY